MKITIEINGAKIKGAYDKMRSSKGAQSVQRGYAAAVNACKESKIARDTKSFVETNERAQKCVGAIKEGAQICKTCAKSASKKCAAAIKKYVEVVDKSESAHCADENCENDKSDAENNTEKASVLKKIAYDIEQIKDRDPAATSTLQVALLYSGFHAIAIYRVAHALQNKNLTFSARALSQIGRFLTGIEIHPGATIGKGLFIDHGAGVVIGETAIVGDNCTIYQGVTLGGTGKHTGKRHPTLAGNVMVGAGAKVLGPLYVGENSKIAAGAVVLKDIPENCTAVGIPAKVVVCDGKKVVQDLDQIHVPDPVANEIRALWEQISIINEKISGENAQEFENTGVQNEDI